LFPKVIGSSWEARFLVNTYAVYFWVDLVDGDKILSLFALFIREQLDIVNNNGGQANKSLSARLGIVQTAYANGASTQFLKSLGLEVVFTPTGVKYLHKRALEYDIGIYFEANGHGTVVFSEDFISQLESLSNELSSQADIGTLLLSVLRPYSPFQQFI
jgi:phosphoacetylglucosamine mutase